MNDSNLYQIFHPWHWLAYGQNAAAFQAIVAAIAAGAGTLAGLFAVKAYKATLTQLSVANEQLTLAHEQMQIERERFATETARLQEARQAALADAKCRYERETAQEDAVRPRFIMPNGFRVGGGPQALDFKNVGETAATDVKFFSPSSGMPLAEKSDVPSGGLISGSFDVMELTSKGVEIHFRSQFGSVWQVIYILNSPGNAESVKSVVRGYA